MGKPLKRLTLAIIETIVEGIEKKPWTAFINNTFDFTAVTFNHKQLVEEIMDAKADPEIMEALEQEACEKWADKYSDHIAKKIFQIAWAALLYNVGATFEIKDVIEEHKQDLALKTQ